LGILEEDVEKLTLHHKKKPRRTISAPAIFPIIGGSATK
jgi:hypothetical protein